MPIKENNARLQIYKGMIDYLMVTTKYTLQDIADLSFSSIKNIRSIHDNDTLPANFSSELHLVRLYHFIVEQKINERGFTKHVA